jgi:hypothetical protein
MHGTATAQPGRLGPHRIRGARRHLWADNHAPFSEKEVSNCWLRLNFPHGGGSDRPPLVATSRSFLLLSRRIRGAKTNDAFLCHTCSAPAASERVSAGSQPCQGDRDEPPDGGRGREAAGGC